MCGAEIAAITSVGHLKGTSVSSSFKGSTVVSTYFGRQDVAINAVWQVGLGLQFGQLGESYYCRSFEGLKST